MLQMQRLYTDMRKVSDELSREPSLESVTDLERDREGQTDRYLPSASPSFQLDRPIIRIDDEEHPVYGRLHRRRSMSTGNLSVFSSPLSMSTTTSDDSSEVHEDNTPDDDLCMCAECEEKRQETLCLPPAPVRPRALSAEPVSRRLSPIRRLLKAARSTTSLSRKVKRRHSSLATDDCVDPIYV